MPALAEVLHSAAARVRPKFSDLVVRTASALVLAPLVLGCVWVGGIAWWVLIGGCFGALAIEWLSMARAGRLGGAAIAAGLSYLAAALVCLIWLRADPAMGRAGVLFLLAAVWASDVGAYLAGRAIGGARLAPRISPGKTWSGAAGGLIAAAVVGMVWAAIAGRGGVMITGALGVLIGGASAAGDLGESWVKRRCGVKDSGRLIPGHGGVLDRVDGLLLAAPAFALLLRIGRGLLPWS